MKVILLFLGVFLVFISPLLAILQTDTHTYSVNENDDFVLAIDRKTGQETFITAGESPLGMIIFGNFGYVLNAYGRYVLVINLKSNTLKQKIPLDHVPSELMIYKDQMYATHYHENYISVIDLKSNTVSKTIELDEKYSMMVIHNHFGYLVNSFSDSISVINLDTIAPIKTIAVGRWPTAIVLRGSFGYVLNDLSKSMSIIDLSKDKVIETIQVSQYPEDFLIYGSKGYVIYRDSGSPSKFISIIDLITNAIVNTILIKEEAFRPVINGELMYVSHLVGSMTVSIIDLKTDKIIATLENPKNAYLGFSETHLYFGLTKIRPLYPFKNTIKKFIARDRVCDYVDLMPDVFNLGEIEPRLYPKDPTVFDELPPYIVMDEIKGFMDDPESLLNLLLTMKTPKKVMTSPEGQLNMMPEIYTALFQEVWKGNAEKVKRMLIQFVQLKDPVITPLVKFQFKKLTPT